MTMVSYGYDNKRPRTQINLDASSLGVADSTSEKPLVLIGSATGGQPHVPVTVTNFAQARDVFRGGELLDAIEMAWNPTPSVGVKAGKIIAIRTDDATQATLTQGALTVTSKLYGQDANSIQVALEDNTLTNSKRFSVYLTKERYEKIYDNIGNIFNIQYTGTEASGIMTITQDSTTHKATTLELSAGEVGAEQVVRTYDLGQGVYEDVHVLVNDINNLPDFTATMNPLGGNKNITTDYLDAVDAVDILAQEVTVTAVAGDLMEQVNNDRYISVSVDLAQAMPDTIPLTNLSGAETNPAPASWSDMIEPIANMGAYIIVPLTDDEAVHGEISQFLRDRSTNGEHLRAVVGGGVDETIESLRARQLGLRNSRVALVGNSGTRRMSDGRVYNFPGYMAAALVAGIESGLPIGEPLTYKHVNIENIDQTFTGDQLDELDAAGIIMFEFVRTRTASYFRVVSDPTTYNVSTEPVQNRVSLGEVSDFLTTELRTELDENFIGTRLRKTSASILKNFVESFLDKQMKVGGLIVDYSSDDVQVVITGNTAKINITVQPAQGLEYINVNIAYEDAALIA